MNEFWIKKSVKKLEVSVNFTEHGNKTFLFRSKESRHHRFFLSIFVIEGEYFEDVALYTDGIRDFY